MMRPRRTAQAKDVVVRIGVRGTPLERILDTRLQIVPLGVDAYAAVRHLHATSMRAQTIGVLSDAELAAFLHLVNSPDYVPVLEKEETYAAWLHDELVGTVSWQVHATNGPVARVGCIFVRHPGFGIGRRLIAEVEARAHQSGFARVAAGVTANAVPFLERLGYVVASRGIKTLGPSCALPVTFLRKMLPFPRGSSMLN
jgi:GNAT superfamily N-acetyltransferase